MVFPLRPGSKRPAIVAWPNQATTDHDRITRWWTRNPTYNIGIATGPSDLHVIDLDTRHDHDGADTLCQLAVDASARASLLTFAVATPNGRHLYYRVPAGMRLPNTASRIGAGIDSRGHGGYVVAAGSRIGPGSYRVLSARPPVVLPDWIVELLAPQPLSPNRSMSTPPRSLDAYLNAIVAAETHNVRAAEPGVRNITLFRASFTLGRLVAGGELDQLFTRDSLAAAAQGHIGIQNFTAREMYRTIASGFTIGANRPRRLARPQ
ncbi:bifunctional DNA primase/polymerase [Nocardia puris]|nr:bifunctional DNA primase/polymerase [Nocardia otitidiscaviarum]MBF6181852.1 bifunctional DNA primase/polymerase [Nocardia otitidiscaviarum]MBF6216260.1 bifunctional DNA primase/polymerase [Nocardia puris]MBF6461745.1 bifunctional DNA primase/polymerase [Nocardia puris]MBF6488144.1 bifunctional DNA primase/polymerase [Nocardia otitidiscaviarum]